MRILLKSCKIIAPETPLNGETKDILIENGIISKIDSSISADVDQEFSYNNLHVSIGWYDSKVNFCDPGLEHKEDLSSGLKAAEAGGMTAVSVSPETQPTISNKSQVEYLLNNSSFSPVDIYPYAAITKNLEGTELSEMFDLSNAGAIAYTDGKKSVSSGIMYRALLYAQNFNGTVISYPFNEGIFGIGQVNEGAVSVQTGLKSIPSIAEYLQIQRDISILEYTGGKMHVTGVSTKEGAQQIKEAKSKGLNITADVHVNNLAFNDEELLGFDTEMKLFPPLRSEEDRKALIAAVNEGVIDVICSDHSPENIENKDVEFDNASFGTVGTQTLFSLLNTIEGISLEKKIQTISKNPRDIFKLPEISLEEGAIANLTLFDPNEEWELTEDQILSKSKNSNLINKQLKGKVLGIINNGVLAVLE